MIIFNPVIPLPFLFPPHLLSPSPRICLCFMLSEISHPHFKFLFINSIYHSNYYYYWISWEPWLHKKLSHRPTLHHDIWKYTESVQSYAISLKCFEETKGDQISHILHRYSFSLKSLGFSRILLTSYIDNLASLYKRKN